MSELEDNKIRFTGILQVEVALAALVFTGVNPPAVNILSGVIRFYEQLEDSGEQEGFEVAIQGDAYGDIRADILGSLGVMATDEAVDDVQRDTAFALKEILKTNL